MAIQNYYKTNGNIEMTVFGSVKWENVKLSYKLSYQNIKNLIIDLNRVYKLKLSLTNQSADKVDDV